MRGEKQSGLVVDVSQKLPMELDIAFTCLPGELIAFFGPSGSGKTTILRVIAGLAKPNAGLITFNGDCWLDTEAQFFRSPQSRKVGFVFQEYALFPHLSVRENLAIVIPESSQKEKSKEVKKLLEMGGIVDHADRFPATLSGGQKQRVALLRALARKPELLLLDEAFAAVDQPTRERLYLDLIRWRRKIHVPTIMVTHNLEEISALADRVVIFDSGKILQIGHPREVLTKPRNESVARIINMRNVFEGTVIGTNKQIGKSFVSCWGKSIAIDGTSSLSPGEIIKWIVPMEKIIFDDGSSLVAESWENSLTGIIGELLVVGSRLHMTFLIDGIRDQELQIEVPLYIAEKYKLGIGLTVRCFILADSIHVLES